MIELEDLRKSFGDLVAVDGATLHIQSGETFGLLGPNGAGKTTTIGMIVGAIDSDGGSVTLAGEYSPRDPAARSTIGVAPQQLALYETLTARENLEFFARLYGFRGKDLKTRTDWSLEFASLQDRQKSRVATFSGGMKRRLNLACALVHDPSVIVMDEPTVGVDPQSRNHIFECIEQLKSEGRTILYTTHYMEEAERLCDRVAIMDEGKILDLDTVSGLIERHGGGSIVTAALAADPPNGVELPCQVERGALTFESDRPLESISQLSAAGVAFSTLEVARPNLEGVFLSLTGRRLRDE